MANLIQFDSGSGDRIARAVREVESQYQRAKPLTYAPVFSERQKAVSAFRVCTYTGPWSIGETKTLTFKYETSTPNTVSATNLFIPVADTATRDCAVARDGTAWYLLQVQWDAATVVVDAALTTAALEFSRVNSIQLGTASTVQISISTCATATA